MAGYKPLHDKIAQSNGKTQDEAGMVHVSVVVEKILGQWIRNWQEVDERKVA